MAHPFARLRRKFGLYAQKRPAGASRAPPAGRGADRRVAANTVRMTGAQLKILHDNLLPDTDLESSAFMTAGFFKNDSGCHFTARDIVIPKEGDYIRRGRHRLEMSPLFFNRVLSLAERDRVTVIQCHSHPSSEGDLQYSPSDFAGESASSKTVRDCLGGMPMGSLLFGPGKIIGRAWLQPGGIPAPIDQLRIVDRHMAVRHLNKHRRAGRVDTDLFDRQIRAFGRGGQEALSSFCVGIVGLGGIGSAVAEQLARAGVSKFVLVDNDTFSPSNMTRLYGSYADTSGRPKVDIVRDNLVRISRGARVTAVPDSVIQQETLGLLKDCDVVFGCTDRHAPRSVLNELAYQFFIPVIDSGVAIDAKDGAIREGSVRVSLLGPSLPCMYCTGVINPDRILAESLDPGERRSRELQGYVSGTDGGDAPSVISLTSMAASYAVLLLKDMLFRMVPSDASTLLVDVKRMKSSMVSSRTRGDCACVARSGVGDGMPLSAPASEPAAPHVRDPAAGFPAPRAPPPLMGGALGDARRGTS